MSSVAPSLPVNKESKEDVTVRLLTAFKWLISEGTLSSGARLPAERDLAEQFQVSRSSLRQALKVLEIMGVISQLVSVEHTMLFHQRIYSAIVEGSPSEARRRMTEHLLDVKNLLSRAKHQQQTTRVQHRISQLAIQPPRTRTRKR